jgi:hypothetical protein
MLTCKTVCNDTHHLSSSSSTASANYIFIPLRHIYSRAFDVIRLVFRLYCPIEVLICEYFYKMEDFQRVQKQKRRLDILEKALLANRMRNSSLFAQFVDAHDNSGYDE